MLKSRPDSNSVAKAFLGTSASSVFVVLATLVSGVVVARALGPEGRGEYGAILLVAQTCATLCCLSFFDGAVVTLRKGDFAWKEALPTMLMAGISITLLSGLALSVYITAFDQHIIDIQSYHFALFIFLIILDILICQCFSSIERSQMSFLIINIGRIASPILFSLSVLLFYNLYGSEVSVGLILILFLLTKLPLVAAWLWRYGRHSFGPLSLSFFLVAGRTGLRLHVAIAITAIASSLDRLFAIAAWSKETLGLYFVAFSAVGAGYGVITSAINIVLLPYMSGLEGQERQAKLSQIIRLTLLISSFAVMAGWILIPPMLPLLYGAEFGAAKAMALALLLSSSVLPLRAVILEANRSTGRGRSSVEMAVVSIAVMGFMYLLTRFEDPHELILAYGLANVISTLSGARYLLADGSLRFDGTIVPSLSDVRYLLRTFVRVARQT